ncbi:MAG: hypothetical protein B7Z40_14175, partial [Bosea sp. 12-68-7]
MASIQGVYLALFGRPADPVGLAFFNQATNNGANLTAIGDLSASAEYQTRFTGQSSTQIITSIYQSLFNREPDLAGLTFFATALANGTLTINNIAIAIFDGAQGSDITIRDLKVDAANAFTAQLDTVAEINGYVGTAAAQSAAAFIATVTTTAPTADQVSAAVATSTSLGAAGQIFTLTAGSDLVGSAGGMLGSAGTNSVLGDDTIVAGLSAVGGPTTNNLGSGDKIDGGTGNDILRVIDENSNITPNVVNVETIRVQALGAAAGGIATTLNLANTTGVTTLENDRSTDTDGLKFTNVQGEATLKITDSNIDTLVNYDPSVNVGTDLTIQLNDTNAGIIGIQINGGNVDNVTDLTVTSTGATNSAVVDIGSANLVNLLVSGDKNLTLDDQGGEFDTLTSVKASDLKADFTLDLTTGTTNTKNVTYTGAQGADTFTTGSGKNTLDTGAGNDIVNASVSGDLVATLGEGDDRIVTGTSLTKADKIDGGTGIDTLAVTDLVDIDNADTPTLTSVEVLAFTGAASGTLSVTGKGAGNAELPADTNTFNFEGGLGGAVTLTNVQNNVTVGLVGTLAGNSLTVDHKTDTASDVLNLNWTGGTNETLSTLSVPDAETINLNIDETKDGVGLTITNLNAPDLNGATFNIKGDGNLTIIDAAAAALTKVDASTATGDIDIAGNFGDPVNKGLQDAFSTTSGVTILTGAGADRVIGTDLAGKSDTIDTGAGNDVIVATLGADTMTLGAGNDTVGYSAVAQSSAATIDTVKDFVSGTDQFDFTQLLGGFSTFVGNFANFGAAQGGVNLGGAVESVFQQDTNTLWVDVNNDGTLNANDLQIVLTGVTTLAQADVNGTAAFPNNILVTAAAADTNAPAVNTLNNRAASGADNIISSSDAFLAGSIIAGLAGTDVLNVSTQATAAGFDTAVISTIETINLAAGSTAITTANVDAKLNTISASAAADVTIDGDNAAITFLGSGAADTFQIGNIDFTGTLNAGGGTDILTSTGGDISGANVGAATTFETFTQTNGDVTMTVAQHNAFTTINGAGAETITLADAGTVTGDADIETYVFNNGAYNFTVGTKSQNLFENGGANIVNIGSQVVDGTWNGYDAGAGADQDVLNAQGGANISGVNAGAVTGLGVLNMVGTVVMTEAQNQDFVANGGINAAGATDQINILTGNLTTVTTDADVETYQIGEDTAGDAVTVNVSGATQTVTTLSANDVITFNLGALTAFSGTLNGGGTANDVLKSTATTLNISAATLNSLDKLDLDGTDTNITMTDAQMDAFIAAGGAAGNDTDISTTGASSTATITTAATFIVDDAGALDR